MSIFSSNKEKQEPAPAYTPPQPASQVPASNTYTPPASSNMTSISGGTTLEGQIKVEGDIRVEGVIKGTVTSKGKVHISASGKVDGDIICQNADIAGHVTGKLRVADILMLKGNAVIDGDINTGKIMIESGVKFNGNCTMGVPAAANIQTPKVETPPKIQTAGTHTSTIPLNAQS